MQEIVERLEAEYLKLDEESPYGPLAKELCEAGIGGEDRIKCDAMPRRTARTSAPRLCARSDLVACALAGSGSITSGSPSGTSPVA